MKKILFIIFVLFILTGCERTVTFFNQEQLNEENREYQYSAPWDKEMYEKFYIHIQDPVSADIAGKVKGGIVPHHLLAGHIDAAFFDNLTSQDPSTIVLLGPNHFGRGYGSVISTLQDWKTPFGTVETDVDLIKQLVNKNLVIIDEKVIKEEHSLYSIIPFINISIPDAKVLPLALRNNMSHEEMDNFVNGLVEILSKDAVIISSIDFSHYQILPVANFHDELSIGVIKSFDYDRLDKLEIDSIPSLYLLMKLMEYYKAQHISYEQHSNSAILVHAPDEELTTSYYSPYFMQGRPDKERVATILHFGDMMLDRNVKNRIDIYGEDHVLGELAGRENRFFSGMDIITANLEGPFANWRRDTSKEIAFRFDPVLIPMLKKYNFSLFTLANNHTLDMGWDAFEESKQNLSEAEIEFYGNQLRLSEEKSLISKEIGGLKFGFIGIDQTILPHSVEDIENLILESEKENDYTIVNVHWGAEYALLKSNVWQQNLAHAMIDAGADVVVGHHPHVIQEMEIYKDRPIFYSLGNFVFDQYFSTPTQQGLGIGLAFHDTLGISAYVFPIQSDNSQNNLMEYEKSKGLMNQLVAASRLGGYTIEDLKLDILFKN